MSQGQSEKPGTDTATTQTPPSGGVRGSVRAAFSSLENRDFRILWFGVGGHAFTLWMEFVARNWLAWELGGTVAVGLINFWRTIPILFLAIPAGVMADRFNRKMILIVTQASILVIYLVLLALLWFGTLELWHAYLLFFLRGAAIAFNQPPRQALIPALVKEHQVANAVSLQQLLFNGTRIVAPFLTGILLGTAGGAAVFAVIVVIEVFVILAWFMLHVPPMLPRRTEAGRPSALQDTLEGLRYVAHHRVVLMLLLFGLLSLLLLQPFMVVLPEIAKEKFNIGPEGFGAFITAMGVGSVIGPLALAFLGDFRAKGALIVGTMAASGLAVIGLGFAPVLFLAMMLMAVIGLFDSSQRVVTNSLLLIQTDSEFHGRVVSLYLLDRGFVPIGSLFAGYLASGIGADFTLAVLGGALTFTVLLVAAVQPRFLSVR